MTYEDIKRANGSIQTMAIERKDKDGKTVSKDYAEVNQRIKAFRMLYPQGFIHTELVSNTDGVCVMRALAGYEDEYGKHVLGTGTAYEKESSSYINRTSYIENCETSAVGRALGMLALGIDTSVASYEEVQNAVNNQAKEEPKEEPKKATISSIDIKEIEMLAGKAKVDMEDVVKQANVNAAEEIPAYMAEGIKTALKKRIGRLAREAQNEAKGQTS